jgi:hypothetical protein
MREACSLIWSALVLLFRSRASLAAEILVLRHQINILRRHSPKRQTFSAMDRLIFAGLYRLAPTVLNALAVLKPDTVDKDAFIVGEGYAGLARRQTGRDHSLPPGPGRAAPPICSDLIYDRHRMGRLAYPRKYISRFFPRRRRLRRRSTLGASLKAGWRYPHSTCSAPAPPLSAIAIKPVPSHSQVAPIFFSINYFLFLYRSIVPKRLGLSCGVHIRKYTVGSANSHYEIVSWP